MAGDEFEEDEAKAGAGGAAGVEEPEVCGGPFLEEAADPADEGVRQEEGKIIQADEVARLFSPMPQNAMLRSRRRVVAGRLDQFATAQEI